jgi:hypothetical protein
MVYEVFCRVNEHVGKRCKVINEIYTDRDKAIKRFIGLSKEHPKVWLQKRRKTKSEDGWREKEKKQ